MIRSDLCMRIALFPLIALAGCGPINRGLETVHQPIVGDHTARVNGCPDWSRPSQPEWDASTTSNYGCAENANLALMIADPGDLIHGKSDSGTDGRSVVKAIKSWRDAKPSGENGIEKVSATSAVSSGSGGK